jgi:Bacterial transcriptional activator domain
VRLDPLREDAHRRLIRLYAETGRRADALRQYDVCVRNLKDDLGVEPLVETSLVAAAVRAGVAPLPADLTDPRHALSELRRALATCQTAVDQIESALTAMTRE